MLGVDRMLAAIALDFASTATSTGIESADEHVLQAMRSVPRDRFVPPNLRSMAWDNRALGIRCGQTISQPFIVALTSQLCAVTPGMRVLEIGTGSGYQAAVLAALGAEVWSIELEAELASEATTRLASLGYRVSVRCGDGALGWPDEAPFARIVGTAAAETVPDAWFEQLAPRGRLVTPLGPAWGEQWLVCFDKAEDGQVTRRDILPVRFVPLRH